MKNESSPAYAITIKPSQMAILQAEALSGTRPPAVHHMGLTKLEYAAIEAMKGLLNNKKNRDTGVIVIASFAVIQAKALLAELEKEA